MISTQYICLIKKTSNSRITKCIRYLYRHYTIEILSKQNKAKLTVKRRTTLTCLQ